MSTDAVDSATGGVPQIRAVAGALIAVAFVLFNAFVDGVYSVLDPRIRHARTAAA